MTVKTARWMTAVCALGVGASSALTVWDLSWALMGLGALAEEVAMPRAGDTPPMSVRETHAMVEGYAGKRLQRLVTFVAASGTMLTLALSIVALSGHREKAKDPHT